jgi:hypothetical protein
VLLVFGSGNSQHGLDDFWVSLAVLEQRFDQYLSAEAVALPLLESELTF